MTEKRRPRTTMISFRVPWLLGEGAATPKPGDSGLLDAGQLRAVGRAIRKARAEGRLSVNDAKIELAQVTKGLEIVEAGPHRDVGAHFPSDECIQPRQTDAKDRRRRNKAARKTRKAQRKNKR